MELYEGQLKTYEFSKEIHRTHHKNKHKDNITRYNNSIITFDIEVTSAWLENGKVIGYRKGMSSEYWNNLEPLSLCYIWQCSCDGTVYYGRELRTFINLLDDLPSDLSTIIWVHNLAYEFSFLSDILEWKSVFARTAHKVIKCIPEKYQNIEFRCSYFLTRLSLDSWGKQLGVHKATGDLDYERIRTPLTKLTEAELKYCEQDCLVVEAGIKDYIRKYDKQRNIPLTQTGTVRLETKNRLMKDKEYVKYIKKLVPKNAREYKMLQNIFAGGFTHANRLYAGDVVQDYIEHYDFASSYPTVMIAMKYPCTPWVYTAEHEIPPETLYDDVAYIMHLRFKRLNSTSWNSYIQSSKSYCVKGTYDNGRVMSAELLEIWVTEQDYLTIKNNYEWESVEVLHLYESKKDYLPREFMSYILELYKNKTELKDVAGQEDLYLQSKQYINSLYGMSVTAIVQANVVLEGDTWVTQPLTEDIVNEKLNSLRFYNPREKRYFLSYSWGCYVTAYARRNLWKCIESCDDSVLYCDTDSIFVIGKHDFKWYNEWITNKIHDACIARNLNFNDTRPYTPKGKQKPLGIFDKEDDCCEFITLGAKRYVERRVTDNKLHLTVSGINKSAVELLQNDINNFRDGFNFDKDAECVNKRLTTYCIDMPVVVYPDGYISTYKKGINLRRTGYVLTMTDEYKELIEYLDMNVEDLPESVVNNFRGRFVCNGEED